MVLMTCGVIDIFNNRKITIKRWVKTITACFWVILFTKSSAAFTYVDSQSGDLVVVVSAQNTLTSLSKKQVVDIYMGRFKTFPNGSAVTPIDFPSGSVEKQTFYKQLVGKNERKVKAYWSRLLFSGRATPPLEAASKQDVISNLSGNSMAYVYKSDVTPEMKIVYQF